MWGYQLSRFSQNSSNFRLKALQTEIIGHPRNTSYSLLFILIYRMRKNSVYMHIKL